MIGDYARIAEYEENMPSYVTLRVYPKKKHGKLTHEDIVRELFDWNLGGEMFVQLVRTPSDEFPVDVEPFVDLLSPDDAVKVLLDWCGWTGTLCDYQGREFWHKEPIKAH
ncbi:MAG: hypothetical protein LIO57_04175 [Oscillospiraceae bacterium]|nr:hypothetical protein [Oscillospiraceae bacterium]